MRRTNIIALAMATALVPIASAANATPVVIAGNYIEAGVSDYGTLGSDGSVSPGLIHDPSGTGSFNPNTDYITPGAPHDGFSLIADQFPFSESDNEGIGDFGYTSPTILTGAAAMGYANAVSWTGSNGYASVTNSYFLNPGDERILVTTTITALSDLTNLAFARSVDPDPDSLSSGTSDTNNQRGNSLFSTDDFIGSAGVVSGLTLALVNVDASGFAHTTSIQSDCCDNINPYDVLSHSAGDLGLSSIGDNGLNLAYQIGTLGTGNSVTLTYAYAVGTAIQDTGGTGAVPEPAIWAMMIGGLGIVGGAMRRRYRLSDQAFTAKIRLIANEI